MSEPVHHYRCGGEIQNPNKDSPTCKKCGKTGKLQTMAWHEKKGMIMVFEGQKDIPFNEDDIPGGSEATKASRKKAPRRNPF